MKLRISKLLIAGIVVIFAGPAVGILWTVISMVFAFHDLGDQGISNPGILAGHIGNALLATWAGIAIALVIGLPLVIAGLVVQFTNRQSEPPKIYSAR